MFQMKWNNLELSAFIKLKARSVDATLVATCKRYITRLRNCPFTHFTRCVKRRRRRLNETLSGPFWFVDISTIIVSFSSFQLIFRFYKWKQKAEDIFILSIRYLLLNSLIERTWRLDL